MKYERTPQVVSDLARLSDKEFELFRKVVREEFAPACDRFVKDRAWPRRLRIKHVAGTAGIYEMTWSFAGPDGRATFEWVSVEGEPRIRWRRVGGHAIFKKP